MSRVPGDIADRSRQVAAFAAAYSALAARAERLAERIDAQRFHVAVVGAFKRGKSTVINALLDRHVLPTGVLPLTAIATEVSYGPPGATIVGLDGTRTDTSLDGLARYVTEAGNPDNMLGVARAEVHVDCPLLATGLVLVDTPGLGSVHGHDADTRRAVDQSDAAIVVLAADMALADDEQQLLTEFGRRNARIFVVVNKADHVDPSERRTVLDFVTAACAPGVMVWAISARAAVDNSGDPGDFDDFRVAIDRFVHDDLAGARDAAAANELRDIATQVAERCQLEAAAASLGADQLGEIAARFRRLAAAERDNFAGDQLLLADRCRSHVHDLSARLTARVRTASVVHVDELNSAANGPLNGIDARLDDAVDNAVRIELAAWQTAETDTIDHDWTDLAANAQLRAAERISTVRRTAADMFAIELPPVAVPSVSDEPDTFWFLLTPPVSMSDPYIHLGRALQPAALRRRRSLHRATSRLTEELDKHAGRLRHALEERLDTARTRFTNAATAALDEAINGINEAIAAAEHAGGIDTDAAEAARRRAARALGLDSLIEIGASTVVLWELSGTGEERQRRALRLIGGSFVALAIYLLAQSSVALISGHRAAHSAVGIIWTATTAAVMFTLAAGKTRTGKDLGNPVLVTEGKVTFIDGVLAVAVLVGISMNAAVGWWWADPLAGLVIVYYAAGEAHHIFANPQAHE